MRDLDARLLRDLLVAHVLEWERRFGVAPSATSAISEFDAAMLVGHTHETFAAQAEGRTAVSRGYDFIHDQLRYQVKANRPSGKPGSKVTLVSRARNYDWDRLVWILYDPNFRMKEAWQWEVGDYRRRFETVKRLGPKEMHGGKQLL